MSDFGCEIEIQTSNGILGTFYFDCEKAHFFNENLENTSGSTIYLYKYKNVSSSAFNPYITIQNYRLPVYRASNNVNGTELSNAHGKFNSYAQFWHYKPQIMIGLYFLLFVYMIISILRRVHK